MSMKENSGVGRRLSVRTTSAWLLAVVLGLAFVGCSAGDESPRAAAPDPPAEAPVRLEATPGDVRTAAERKTFVGAVSGTDAYVALSVTPGRPLRAYVCDGKGVKQWFTGTLAGDRVEAAADTGEATLTATGSGDAFAGTVVVGGVEHGFRVERASDPAGLYVASDPTRELRGTWIVLPDGSQRGAATKSGVPTETTVSPDSGTADVGGTTVEAGSGSGTGSSGSGSADGVFPLAYPKKIASTCQKLEADYNANLAAYNNHLAKGEGAQAQMNKDAMDGILGRMVKIGCISF